mmetsp:Transcript_53989/g.153809  ORF Transcript_53989/g.153809 Transcript_53989/m.153809 type:complete len:202 (-) Transcript_53989:992-1597(-)
MKAAQPARGGSGLRHVPVCDALPATAPSRTQRVGGTGNNNPRQQRCRRHEAETQLGVRRGAASLVGRPVEGPVFCPGRKTHVGAAEPPFWVSLAQCILTAVFGFVPCHDVAAILAEHALQKLPPLRQRCFCECVALLREPSTSVSLGHGSGRLLPLGNTPPSLLLDLVGLGLHLGIDQPEVQIGVLVDELEGPPCNLAAEL